LNDEGDDRIGLQPDCSSQIGNLEWYGSAVLATGTGRRMGTARPQRSMESTPLRHVYG